MLSLKWNKIQWLWNYLVKYDTFYFMWQKNSDTVNHLLRYKTPKLDVLDTKIDNDTEQLEFA